MTEHIRYSLKKASGRVNRSKKIRYLIDSKTAAIVYQSIILPIIVYCPFATYGATPNYMKENKLSMENRAEKIIGGSYVIPRSENVKQYVTVSKIISQSNKSDSAQDIPPW